MKELKIHLNLALYLIIISTIAFFLLREINPPTVQVVTASQNLTLFQQPQHGRTPLLEQINNAKKQIDIAVYLLSDIETINALIKAKQRDVWVKVMLEQHPYGGGNINPKTKKTLEKNNIQVQWSNPTYELTHQKAVIIDKSKLLVLNQNLTQSAFDKNREYDIIDSNKEDVTEAENIFTSDWQRKPFTPNNSHLVISPYTARSGLSQLLQNAQLNLSIEMEVLTDNEIIETLVQKAKKTKVRVILPEIQKIQANAQAAQQLIQSGVQVRILSSPYLHAKLILQDNTIAYIGSINFTTQSMDQNREMGIIISQPSILQKLQATFENDWNLSTDYKQEK